MASFQRTPSKGVKSSPSKSSPLSKNTPTKLLPCLSQDEVRRALYLQLLILRDTLNTSSQQQEAIMQQDIMKAWQVVYDIENEASSLADEAIRTSAVINLNNALLRMVNVLLKDVSMLNCLGISHF